MNYYAGDRSTDTYLISPRRVFFKDHDPKVRVFSSKKARDAYVGKSNACELPARIARKWVNNYSWAPIHAWGYAPTLEDYLRRFPQNDLRSL